MSVALLVACADTDVRPRTLPVSPTIMIPTGDPAGAATRDAHEIVNPYRNDPRARAEGQRLFREMNCQYCHGEEGEGGMGPNLVDSEWLFGDTPADRFASIWGGRARGMPAYGRLLPDESIWKLVSHVEHLRTEAGGEPVRAGGAGAQDTRRAQQPAGTRRP